VLITTRMASAQKKLRFLILLEMARAVGDRVTLVLL
jgi:hypothetical protein